MALSMVLSTRDTLVDDRGLHHQIKECRNKSFISEKLSSFRETGLDDETLSGDLEGKVYPDLGSSSVPERPPD